MKKLLVILGAFGLTATGASSVVACGGNSDSDTVQNIDTAVVDKDGKTVTVTFKSGTTFDSAKTVVIKGVDGSEIKADNAEYKWAAAKGADDKTMVITFSGTKQLNKNDKFTVSYDSGKAVTFDTTNAPEATVNIETAVASADGKTVAVTMKADVTSFDAKLMTIKDKDSKMIAQDDATYPWTAALDGTNKKLVTITFSKTFLVKDDVFTVNYADGAYATIDTKNITPTPVVNIKSAVADPTGKIVTVTFEAGTTFDSAKKVVIMNDTTNIPNDNADYKWAAAQGSSNTNMVITFSGTKTLTKSDTKFTVSYDSGTAFAINVEAAPAA